MKNVKDKFKKLVKNKNFVVAMCVLGLTIIVIGVSYASFFAVRSNSKNQSVKSGDLNISVTYPGNRTAINNNNILPMSDKEALKSADSIVLAIQNIGSIDSHYTITVGYDMENFNSLASNDTSEATKRLTPIDYIKVALFEYNNNVETQLTDPISLAELPIYTLDSSDHRNNRYSLYFGDVGGTSSGNVTKTYLVKIWLSDEATTVASHTYFYVNASVVAEAQNAQMKYNISGNSVYVNSSGSSVNFANSKIIIHNGSKVVTTDAKGDFTIDGLYPGDYNISAVVENKKYKGHLRIEEGSTFSISAIRSTSTNIYQAAKDTAIPIADLLKYNNLDSYSDAAPEQQYNRKNNYKIVGTSNPNIENIAIDFENNYALTMSKY